MTRRMLLASLALVLVTAGCGGSSKSSFPTIAPAHTYVLTVHFLSSQIEIGDGAGGEDMLTAIDAVTTSSAQVTGTFART